MAIITVRVSDEEKEFLTQMAKFEGKSLSELMKTATLEALEDAYDAKIGDLAYEDYLKNPETISLKDFAKELGIN